MRSIARGLSTDRHCKIGAMIEGNISGTDKKNSSCFYCPDILKTNQTETKPYQFSRDTSGEELKI